MKLKEMKEHLAKRVALNVKLLSANEVVADGAKYLALSFSDDTSVAAGRITKKYQADDYFSMVGNVVFVKAVVKEDEDGSLYLSVSKIEPTEEGIDVGPEETEEVPESKEKTAGLTDEKMKTEATAPEVGNTGSLVTKAEASDSFLILLAKNLLEKSGGKVMEKIAFNGHTVYETIHDAGGLAITFAGIRTFQINSELFYAASVYYTIASLYKGHKNSFVADDENGAALGIGFVAAEIAKKVADMVKEDERHDLSMLNALQHALLAVDVPALIHTPTEKILNDLYGKEVTR